MGTAQSKLDILIEAKQNASPQVKQLTGDLKSLDDAAETASKGLGGLVQEAGVAGFADLAGEIVSVTMELGQLGAQSIMVENSFANMTEGIKSSSGEVLSVMHAASQGMIADQVLMLNANRAMILGVADSTNELGALLEIAGARAKIMGTEVSTAYADLVSGIGTMQADVLDNLGLRGGTKAIEDYARSVGKTTSELSDAERKQALLNMAIRDTLPYLDDGTTKSDLAAQGFQTFGTATANLRDELGQLIAMGVGPWLGSVAGGISDIANIIGMMTKGQRFSGYGGDAGIFGDAKPTDYGQKVLAEETQKATDATGKQSEAVKELNKAYDSAHRSIASLASGQLGALGATGVLAVQKDLSAELGVQVRLWQDMMIDPAQIANVLIPGWLDQQREVTKETTATGRAVSQVNSEYSDLVSKAKSVLSGALNTGVASADSILESMGLREDAINEDARRLADVAVKGFDSPWADYFRASRPGLFDDMFFGDIKSVAAQQLKDFEDGLNPELIDRGRAKERIKRMITGDANMAELATEIASELAAEMGVPLQQALASAQGALGVGGSQGGAGTDAARSFNDGAMVGLEETNAGGSFVAGYTNQIRSSFSLLRTAGQDAAKAWSDSFYGYASDHLSPALIDLLATLITPAVQGKIAQQGTLTGAVNQ